MSVINQMLKDLDQRHNDAAGQVANTESPIIANKPQKTGLIIVSTIMLTLLIVFAAYLYKTNQALTASLQQKTSPDVPVKLPAPQVENNAVTIEQVKVKKTLKKPIASAQAIKVNETNANTASTPSKLDATKETKQVNQTELANNKSTHLTKNQPEPKKQTSDLKATVSTAENTTKKASISVSRRKVSAHHLAQQKMQQAEDAVRENELSKAETLFADILVLTPTNKVARKQLAALWFGRKSYQSALNLLSQGIALSPNDNDFRLMQARIYLRLGNNKKALQVLEASQPSNNIEYLVTLANVAQELAKYTQAINAYKQLATIQPNEGRWWLGLAVAYDSNSEYLLAANAYRSALAQGQLSKSSTQFAKNRLAQLGE